MNHSDFFQPDVLLKKKEIKVPSLVGCGHTFTGIASFDQNDRRISYFE